MKPFVGAIMLSLAVPAFAQAVPATGSGADQVQLQPAQCQNDDRQSAKDTPKHCRDMMKHRGQTSRRDKTKAEKLDAEFNGNGHQGHKH